jgi:hypothetical protein
MQHWERSLERHRGDRTTSSLGQGPATAKGEGNARLVREGFNALPMEKLPTKSRHNLITWQSEGRHCLDVEYEL